MKPEGRRDDIVATHAAAISPDRTMAALPPPRLENAMTTATTLAVNAGAGLARRAAAAAAALGNAVYRWYRRERDRRHVLQLDDYLLRDVGLTRDGLHAALHERGGRWTR
jgi:uncharacterized protein YjiS (DUF1127 family)